MELMQPEIIQILRRRCNMNQGALGAAAFDTSLESGRTKIKNIELGRQIPTPSDLEKMAGVLGVPVAALDPARANSVPAPVRPAMTACAHSWQGAGAVCRARTSILKCSTRPFAWMTASLSPISRKSWRCCFPPVTHESLSATNASG